MDAKRILEVLTRYLSPINAQGLLSRTMRTSDMMPHDLRDGDVRELVARLEQGARLFVVPARQADLTRDLRALLPTTAPASHRLQLASERDLALALQAARELASAMGARPLTLQAVATIASELARNIVSYTPGGVLELIPDPSGRSIVIRATDRGTGISNLPEILAGRYKSKTGLGRGLLGCSRLAKRFDIKSGATGTVVEAVVSWG